MDEKKVPDINQVKSKPAQPKQAPSSKGNIKKQVLDAAKEELKKKKEEETKAQEQKKNSFQKLHRAMKIMKKAQFAIRTGINALALYKVAQFLAGVWESIKSAVAGFISWIQNGLVAIGNALASMTIGTALTLGAVIVAPLTLAAYAYDAINGDKTTEVAKLDPIPEACSVEVDKIMKSNGIESDSDKERTTKEEIARKIYSVLKTMGLSDIQIAAALGCWEEECHLDYTCIETAYLLGGNYSVPYKSTPEKEKLIKHHSEYFVQFVKVKASDPLDIPGYTGLDGTYYPGVGLAQWTGKAGEKFLRVAKETNNDWFNFDYQIAYAVSKQYKPEFFEREDWNAPGLTLEAATKIFLDKYEYGGHCSREDYLIDRIASAKYWLAKIKKFDVDSSYGSKILGFAEDIGGAAVAKDTKEAYDLCKTDKDYGALSNASIAEAGASMAWDQMSSSYNYGTDLYQEIVTKVVPDMFDPSGLRGRNCTTATVAIVRWAGADDDFPGQGNPIDFKNYMDNSDKWKLVGTSKEVHSQEDAEKILQPGDVCVIPGPAQHIGVYTGREAIQEFTSGSPNLEADSVHAAGVYPVSSSMSLFAYPGNFYSHMTHHTSEGGTYYFYRNIKPEANSKYASIRPGN